MSHGHQRRRTPPATFASLTRCALLLMCSASAVYSEQSQLTRRLEKAKAIIEEGYSKIYLRWDVVHYPHFLKAPSLSSHAWDLMKLRLQERILATTVGEPQQWLIAFMGSSVTAGRDSPVNQSVTAWTLRMMAPAFAALDIQFKVTNNAMENNPCVPYDLCVKAFAGTEADMVHWEQTYYCERTREMYEQFARQALSLPSHPLVVFASSNTDHWEATVCDPLPSPHELTPEEDETLNLLHQHQRGIKEQFTKRNTQNYPIEVLDREFQDTYAAAGIQTFFHTDYKAYMCLGPYGPDFGEGASVSYHPSPRGQELRAAHYSLLWLHVLHDAVLGLLHHMHSGTSIAHANDSITQHLHTFQTPLPSPLHPSDFVDTIQCFTDMETRNDRSSSLRDLVIATNLTNADSGDAGWAENMFFKQYVNSKEFEQDKEQHRPDVIVCLRGNNESGLIHFSFTAISHGMVFICSAQEFWGVQPQGFVSFSDSKALVYLTRTKAHDNFVFDVSATIGKNPVKYDKKPSNGNCVGLSELVQPGPFVLSIAVPSPEFVALSYALVP